MVTIAIESGLVSSACSEQDGSYGGSSGCYLCGESGHISRDRKGGSGGGGNRSC